MLTGILQACLYYHHPLNLEFALLYYQGAAGPGKQGWMSAGPTEELCTFCECSVGCRNATTLQGQYRTHIWKCPGQAGGGIRLESGSMVGCWSDTTVYNSPQISAVRWFWWGVQSWISLLNPDFCPFASPLQGGCDNALLGLIGR